MGRKWCRFSSFRRIKYKLRKVPTCSYHSMETIIDRLKAFLQSRNSNVVLNQPVFTLNLSARIKLPCDIHNRLTDSIDWLQEMQFSDIRIQEEGSDTDYQSKSKDVLQLEDRPEKSLEILPSDAHQNQRIFFKNTLPKFQEGKIPDHIGIYVDVADDSNAVVKQEGEMENDVVMGPDNFALSGSIGNAETDAKNDSNDIPLVDEDADDFESSMEDDSKNIDSDDSWNTNERNVTKIVKRKKAESARGKRKKNLLIKNDGASETRNRNKIRKGIVEKCEDFKASNKDLKSKRRRSSRKKIQKKYTELEDNTEISENQEAVIKNKKFEKKMVSCEDCGEQFDQIRAFNVHLDTHSNSLETKNSEDAKIVSVMRLDATQIEILETEIEETKDTIKNNNDVIEIKLVEISEENGMKVGQAEFSGGDELLSNSKEITNKQDCLAETHDLRHHNKLNGTENKSIVNCNTGAQSSNVSKKVVKKDYDVLCCSFCERKFQTITKYNTHIQSHSTERPFVCDQCKGSYKTEEHLKIHKINVHHQKRFPCESCDRSFKYKISLERHFTSNHKLLKPHICHICGKDYYSKSSLIDHISRHSKDKPYKCDICNQYYHSQKLLSQHTAHHFALLKHQCDQCGKSFKNIGNLRRHLEQHASQRNYVCEICQMAFTLKRYYTRHKVIHDPQRAVYKCDKCFKQFANKTNLDRHKLTLHSDAKPFQCDVCSKAFKLKTLLEQHARVHKEEKDYNCEFCKKKFSFNSSLHSHIKNHHKDVVISKSKTPEATFKCKICENLFYSKSALNSHYKFHRS